MFQNQHGFVRNKSSTSEILSLINVIVVDLENRQYVRSLFFLSKEGFDTVNDLVLNNINNMGIRGVGNLN